MSAAIAMKELTELGYTPTQYPNEVVGFVFKIPTGKFKDQVVEIALDFRNFPDIPPPGPNIRPKLLPLNPIGGVPPYAGVHNQNIPNSEFQYWSRPFPGWEETNKTVRVYLAFLRRLFDFEE